MIQRFDSPVRIREYRLKISYLAVLPFILLMTVILTQAVNAQFSSVYTEQDRLYKEGKQFYADGLFAEAKAAFRAYREQALTAEAGASESLRNEAALYEVLSAVHLGDAEAVWFADRFIREHSPGLLANQATYEMGNYYYRSRDYATASQYYSRVEPGMLSPAEADEMLFKRGYSQFVLKQFAQAGGVFNQLKNRPGQYQSDAMYYFALTEYYRGRERQALEEFRRLENDRKYGRIVPFYIAQIMFNQGEYAAVAQYGTAQLNDRNQRYVTELNLLVGQSYFELREYEKAYPHLEANYRASRSLREQDLYQLAYVQYKTGRYDEAIRNFEQLDVSGSAIAQNAMYHLGDAYLKRGNKNAARNAFDRARRMDHNKELQATALLTFAKLSYELGYHRDAIEILQDIPPGSPHYNEAQTMLSDLFINTRDYENALRILESIPNRGPKLQEAYQKVTYLRAIQLYNDRAFGEAEPLFHKSIQTGVDMYYVALSKYWLGQIAYEKDQYDQSIRYLNEFVTAAAGVGELPEASGLITAYYTLGYNYLKKETFSSAQSFFERAIQGIEQQMNHLQSDIVKRQIYADALLRHGDAALQRNQYDRAQGSYQKVIQQNLPGADYAMFQRGIIFGVQGRNVDKLMALESMVSRFPRSNYAPDALLNIGVTYQTMNRPNEARENLLKLVNGHPNSPLVNQAYIQLGLIAFNMGRSEEALNYYKQVFANNPASSEARDALKNIEEIYIEEGNPDGYFAFIESIPGLAVNVTDLARDSINFRAAEAQYIQGDYTRAVQAYTNYINSFPNGRSILSAYFHRGESHFALREYSKAKPDYEEVISRGRSSYLDRALRKAALISYNIDRDFAKAFQQFKQLEEIATSEDIRFEAQINALRSAYRTKNAQGVYMYASKVETNTRADNRDRGEASYYLGKTALEMEELEKARTAFNRTIQLMDNEWSAEARFQIAYIYYLQRDLEIARQLCLNIRREIPSYEYWVARSVVLLGDIFAEEGEFFNARVAYESIIENYTGDDNLVEQTRQKLARLDAGQLPDRKPIEDRPQGDQLLMDDPDNF